MIMFIVTFASVDNLSVHNFNSMAASGLQMSPTQEGILSTDTLYENVANNAL